MKEKKRIMNVLIFIVPISLSLAISFYIYELYLGEEVFEFIWSLFLNIFAGSSVLLITTRIEYSKNRKDVLEKLFIEFSEYCNFVSSLKPLATETGERLVKEVEKYYEFAFQSFKELDWTYGQLYLSDKDELFKCCETLYDYRVSFAASLMEFRKECREDVSIETKILLLQDLQIKLFNVEKIENEDSIVTYYESKVISKMDLLLTKLLDMTYNRRKVEYRENIELNKKGFTIEDKS